MPSGKLVDSKCHQLTASWIREKSKDNPNMAKCSYYESLEALERKVSVPSGVYTLKDITDYGKANGLCPYFLSRQMINHADVVVYSYYYLLDPKIADLVSKELSQDCIVVFDEAHNIDNVCIESMSVDINRSILDAGSEGLHRLTNKIETLKKEDSKKLRDEYEKLVKGLRDVQNSRIANEIMSNPILPDDLLKEAVPGNIRQAEHFVSLLKRLIEFLKTRFRGKEVLIDTPAVFLKDIEENTLIARKPLRFAAERLASLVKTLELTDIENYQSLQTICYFATILATYKEKGFTVIYEPTGVMNPEFFNPILHLTCLDASLAISPVFQRFNNVIITSGTLSPLEMYPKILNFKPVVMHSFNMTLSRNSFSPVIITRGSDQVAMTSKFDVRNDLSVVRNYGILLADLSRIVPDGLVCFFPSYTYLESILPEWEKMQILTDVMKHKLLFIETPDAVETSIALENYRIACENGRGAVLLSVARGKVSEGIDFDHHYGRCVVMFGIPYQNTLSRILRARLEYLREQFRIRDDDFLTFDALRHASQCVGRVLRGKSDYGMMIFADKVS
jgi:DNA excision repair protein ERCC-2